MKTRQLSVLVLVMFSFLNFANAQEKGLFKKNPKITPNQSSNSSTKGNPNFAEQKPEKDGFDDYAKETPKVKIVNQFEPAKPINPVVHEDTSTIDEGKVVVTEQVDSIKVGDDWVQAAHYYMIWDSRTIDPYNLDPRQFEETIKLQLFDPNKNLDWHLPLKQTKVTSQFGPRWGRWHEGMDIDADTGDPVFTTYDGIVRVVGFNNSGYGNFVLVRHYNGLETLYGHLSKFESEVGQLVKAGDLLGLAGNTGRSYGSHLHYENRYEGNPFSPAWIWDFPNQTILNDNFVLSPRVWDHLRGGAAYQGEFDASKSKLKHTVMHRVRRGETLAVIAAKYGLTPEELAELNNIDPTSALRPGLQLRLK